MILIWKKQDNLEAALKLLNDRERKILSKEQADKRVERIKAKAAFT